MRGSANLTDDQLIDEVARACDESSPFSKASRGAALMRIAPELASRLKAANALLDERLTQVSALHIELKATSGRLDAANDVKAAQKIVLEHLEKELKAANEKLAECESGVIDMTIEEARIRAREKIDYDNCD